ncbi:MAG: DUF1512 family protein [Candidatus Aenigmatarchaeota archaeon]|nr:DUF1512 domain-containing protein [Candidatus Aenigmarchaeota archaeon]
MLAQIGGQTDLISTILWFLIFLMFIIFGPRLMIAQTVLKLEKDVSELETMANHSRERIAKFISKKPTPLLRSRIGKFMDFFSVSPVSVDPYGIIRKIDMVVRQSDARFKWFVKQIAPDLNAEQAANVKNALAGAMTVHQIAKVVRHFLELIKKYKIYQLALIFQMQLPLIRQMAKAAEAATGAFVDGVPIGDGIGSLVAAHLMQGKPKIFADEEFAVSKSTVAGRKVLVAKAAGPGASTGYPGKFLIKLTKRERIDRIITIDAGLRLEGEKTGSVAEGVGVAMGGTGVDRYEIEEFAVKHGIPLDAVVIKVNEEEALSPMHKNVLASVHDAISAVEEAVRRADRRERILIMGVGNTCGIGNSPKAAKAAEEKVRTALRKIKPEKKKWSFS